MTLKCAQISMAGATQSWYFTGLLVNDGQASQFILLVFGYDVMGQITCCVCNIAIYSLHAKFLSTILLHDCVLIYFSVQFRSDQHWLDCLLDEPWLYSVIFAACDHSSWSDESWPS